MTIFSEYRSDVGQIRMRELALESIAQRRFDALEALLPQPWYVRLAFRVIYRWEKKLGLTKLYAEANAGYDYADWKQEPVIEEMTFEERYK